MHLDIVNAEDRFSYDVHHMSRIMRKPDFCVCENKGADQHLCFRYTYSTLLLLPKSEISSVSAQAGLCQTGSETPKTSFLASRLIYFLPMICMIDKTDKESNYLSEN